MTMRITITRQLLLRCSAALFTLWLAGCSTTAGQTDLKKAEQRLDTSTLRILYFHREVKLDSSSPYFTNANLSETIADLGLAVMEQLPPGLAAVGIETATYSVQTNAEAQLPPDAVEWLNNTHPDWPVLFIVPAGGWVFCTPCSFKTDAILELREAFKPGQVYWSARLKQPAVTPGLAVGIHPMHVHFANEMLRAVLANVRGTNSL
jgi:hypothetical protein